MLEHIMELPQTTETQTFFDAGCHSELLQLLPHQRLHAVMPTGSGGLDLALVVSRRVSATSGMFDSSGP